MKTDICPACGLGKLVGLEVCASCRFQGKRPGDASPPSYPRVRAMLAEFRQLAKDEVRQVDLEFAADVEKLLAERDGLSTMHNALAPGWEAPNASCKCGAMCQVVAHNEGDGWSLDWSCPECGADYMAGDGAPNVSWPFLGDYARAVDFERIGIMVE